MIPTTVTSGNHCPHLFTVDFTVGSLQVCGVFCFLFFVFVPRVFSFSNSFYTICSDYFSCSLVQPFLSHIQKPFVVLSGQQNNAQTSSLDV